MPYCSALTGAIFVVAITVPLFDKAFAAAFALIGPRRFEMSLDVLQHIGKARSLHLLAHYAS